MDVTDAASVQAAVDRVLAEAGRIDVVVNNAGIGYAGAVEDTSLAEARATFETNFFGALRVCKAVLPAMRAQGAGLIVNVSSIGGLMGLPYQGLYSASKYALEGLSEALRIEVRPFGVRVVLVEPGDIRTAFTANRRSVQRAEDPASPYREQYRRTLARIEADEVGGAPPEVVARTVARIVANPRPRLRYVVGPFYEQVAVWIKRLVPAGLFEWLMRMNYRIR
jgi:NAD(P)-dependent dehydrogenase (short-subunit alcohol dehydrogenase family)